MPALKVGDINVYYEIHGKGEPLVMLPGITCSITTTLFRQIPLLAKNYRVIAVDPRGSGLTDKPDIPYSMEMMTNDTVGLLAALGVRKAHVYGESMGGMIAQHLALLHPQMVANLILGCTTCGGGHSVQPDQAVLATFFDMQGTPDERMKRVGPLVLSQNFMSNNQDVVQHFISLRLKQPGLPYVYMRQGGAIMTHDTYDRLLEIGVPTLVIAGTEDKLVPVENSRILASRITGAELVILQGVGHFLSIEAPEAVDKAIRGFLKRHPIAA